MRAKSLKVVLALGLFSFMAWGLPACSDDDGGGGSSGTGGTAGSGGSAGSAGASGSGGSGGAVTCGGETCTSWKLGGLVPLKACCDETDKCAALSDSTIKSIAGVAEGCYALGQPGNIECDCPDSPEFINPISNEPASFPGCCRPDGKCGYMVDLTSADGPDIGCVAAWDTTTPPSCTAGPDNPCPEPDGGTDGGSNDASTD